VIPPRYQRHEYVWKLCNLATNHQIHKLSILDVLRNDSQQGEINTNATLSQMALVASIYCELYSITESLMSNGN
jgi:hypothetical protein